ncbi:hypothetical protein SOHN41_00750 [Shewanella sp. HN-41]|nr:hypothetical protein SOHN41_00750 [Shewanella sp. HN-41]
MFELRLKIVLLFFLLVPPVFIYFVFIKDDHKFINVMTDVSKTEVYQAIKLSRYGKQEEIIRFADFYDCLQAYQPLWKRKFPEGHPSEDFYLQVFIPSKDLLFFNVRSNEAYHVFVRSMDENGVYQDSSGTHAINCSIDLIDFVDKSEVF